MSNSVHFLIHIVLLALLVALWATYSNAMRENRATIEKLTEEYKELEKVSAEHESSYKYFSKAYYDLKKKYDADEIEWRYKYRKEKIEDYYKNN